MKIWKIGGIVLAVLVSLALLWLAGGDAWARDRQKKAELAWVQSFGPLQALLDRYPKTATNDTAWRLEKLVEPLGLDLRSKTQESMSARLRGSQKATEGPEEEGRHAASAYLTAELEKPDAAIGAPPPEVNAFLSAHAGDLNAIKKNLLASPPPTWGFVPAIGSNPRPIPDAYTLFRIQRILLAKSLQEAAAGDDAAARETVEASWRLNETLRDVPDILCQLLALAITRLQIGALRKVEVDANLWRARLVEHDFKRSVLDSELLGLWPRPERDRQLEENESRSKGSLWKRVQALFCRPCEGIVWSEEREKMRLAYLRIKDSPVLDEKVLSSAAEMLSTPMPNLLDTFRRADRLVLDTELTAKILQARELRLQNGPKWPATIPGIEASRFPGAKWIYSVSPEGTMSLSLTNGPHWDTSGPVLPTRFTSS